LAAKKNFFDDNLSVLRLVLTSNKLGKEKHPLMYYEVKKWG